MGKDDYNDDDDVIYIIVLIYSVISMTEVKVLIVRDLKCCVLNTLKNQRLVLMIYVVVR
jgi:hypothetical protein